jgi:DnaJ-like protein
MSLRMGGRCGNWRTAFQTVADGLTETPDYYAVLGVDESASLREIQRAFRQKALKAHPDAGGSHEQMVLVAEAWAALSDPNRRAAYDRQRESVKRCVNDPEWTTVADNVRAEAHQYPRDFQALRTWLGLLASDVGRAKYGSERFLGLKHSTISDSWSGSLMMTLCVVIATRLPTVPIPMNRAIRTSASLCNHFSAGVLHQATITYLGDSTTALLEEFIRHGRPPIRVGERVRLQNEARNMLAQGWDDRWRLQPIKSLPLAAVPG